MRNMTNIAIAGLFVWLSLVFFCACSPPVENKKETIVEQNLTAETFTVGDSIETRFLPPYGFVRTTLKPESFGAYLRHLPLKAPATPVYCFNGELKYNQTAHAAVIDIDVGTRDLQQCADAVMRLRAEYLWQKKEFAAIQFHFTNGFLANYSNWRAGKRIKVNGNRVYWTASNQESTSYQSFRSYLNMVFAYAGTLSLAKELQARKLSEVEVGDVFIQPGSPGHAIIVVDMAHDPQTGEQLLLLAQSYMPAQDIHILNNPSDSQRSPWYTVSSMNNTFETPEWAFHANDLKSFN